MPSPRQIVKKLLKPLFYLTADRERALGEEVGYWEKFLRDKLADYHFKLDPKAPVSEYHRALLDRVSADVSPIRVLDVGSGPMTAIGKVYSRPIEIVPVDPLADEYAKLLAKYGVVPLVKTRKGEAETVVQQFGPESFDLVVACNSLDHGYDPFTAIRAMIQVTKRGGVLALQHVENVAQHESYRGLHQWDFTMGPTGSFVLTGRRGTIDVTREVASEIALETRIVPMDGYKLVEVAGVRR